MDENGRILKSETFYEIDNEKERTITLLPSERKHIERFKGDTTKQWVNYILESRGDELKEKEEPDLDGIIKDNKGILTIKKG